jgi:hydroxymethylglutaryl-CoA reductase (NADPH)
MQVPSFLLRRLYVKGSLRNEAGGLAFDLSNTLGSGYADQVLPLRIDGEDIPPETCAFVIDGVPLRFDAVSAEKPMTLAMNGALTVRVDARTLSPGEHTVEMAFIVTGMGEMRFDVKDTIDG